MPLGRTVTIAAFNADLVGSDHAHVCSADPGAWLRLYGRRRAQRSPNDQPIPGARNELRWWDPVSWWRVGRQGAASDVLVIAWTTPFHALAYALIKRLARPAKIVAIVHNAVPHEALPPQRPLSRWNLDQIGRSAPA